MINLTENTNQFVVDAGNDHRFVIVISDEDDLSHVNVYPCSPYSNDAGPYYDNKEDYNPLGAVPFGGTPTWNQVWVTDLYIAS